MQKHGDSLLLSASDLVGHLNCGHLTGLDIAVANGTLAKPASWDPLLELLWERGAQHEHGFVEHLSAQRLAVTSRDSAPRTTPSRERLRRCVRAMRSSCKRHSG
jgi:hypothetical protein